MIASKRTGRISLVLLSLVLIPCLILGGPREALDSDLSEAAGIRFLIGGWLVSWFLGGAAVLLRRSARLGTWSRSTMLVATGSIAGNVVWFHTVGSEYAVTKTVPVIATTRLVLDLALLYSALAVPTLALYWKVTPNGTGSEPASGGEAE